MSISRERKTRDSKIKGQTPSWNILTRNKEVEIFNSDDNMEWKSPWYFVQGTDSQYGFIERCLKKSKVSSWDEEIELTEHLVKKINALKPKPKFFVICGDMCDAIPVESLDVFKSQEATFKKIFSKIDPSIPVLVTCGNRDLGDKLTNEALDIYKTSWGDDYYSFWCGGILFIIINTQYFMNPENDPKLVEEQNKWLYDKLRNAKENHHARIIMFQHVPWFLRTADEPDNKIFSVRKEIRGQILDKLEDSGVVKVFCGHYHRNAGGLYKDLEVVVSSAIGGQLGSDISGVRIVKVYETRIDHSYYGINDIPLAVKI